MGSQTHSPQTHVLARPGSRQSALHASVLQPQSAPLQPASHAHVLQLHQPLSLHVFAFTSTGQGKTDSLQNVPVQPVPVGHTHSAHSQEPPLAAHAGSHADRSQSHAVPFQPPSQAQTPHSHVPCPAHAKPLAAGAQGEKDTLQWGPL